MNILKRLQPPVNAIAHAWTGHYKTQGVVSDADCVLGFSFGYRGKRSSITPGLSNQDLATVALKHATDMPKILQFEIADAYKATAKNVGALEVISKHHRKGLYLDTREVAVQAKAIMDKNGWETALLLAHPAHMPRVQVVCDALGIAWVATKDERGAVEFDPQSTQKWTRSLDAWRGYEPMALMFYRLKGWL